MKNFNKGFTLVEIAIVLVIIGLLLGGVLKGQELIVSAKTKRVVQDFKSITVAHMSYYDRYRVYPGDPGPGANANASGDYFADIIDKGFFGGVTADASTQYGGNDSIKHAFNSKFSHWRRGEYHVLCAEGLPEDAANQILLSQGSTKLGEADEINNMSTDLKPSTSVFFQYVGGPMDKIAICKKLSSY